ncbi:MAG: hypothetical protein MOGMAGMI_00702 [Candidatus Omnitrophica bacterium]|nr:hypothetical protein [Candidatus Omnitrophota bacterium]
MLRRIGIGLAVCLLAVLALSAVVREQVRKALAEVFIGSRVSVGSLRLEEPWTVSLSEIRITASAYEIDVRKVLLDRGLHLTLLGPVVTLRAIPSLKEPPRRKNSRAVSGAETRVGARLSLGSIRARGLELKYRIDGITADLSGDVVYEPGAERFTRIDLDVPSLRRDELLITDARVRIGSHGEGEVSVGTITRQKVRLTGVRAHAQMSGRTLVLSDLEARLADGRVTGTARVDLTAPTRYEADLRIGQLDLAVLSRDLGIADKVGLNGLLDGRVALSGDAQDLRSLTGQLSGTEKGGDLIIQDKATLEHLARNIRQPQELVEAAFKEYHFDTASATLELSGDDLGLKVQLEGTKGKRYLEIKLHDLL